MKPCLASFVLAAWLLSGHSYAASLISDTSGQFVFEYKTGETVKKIPVYYAAPKSLTQATRVVFVLHGNGRKSEGYRKEWQPYAAKYNYLVLCPEFSEADFPDIWQYNYGNVYDNAAKRWTPRNEWTFNAIEGLFDFVRQDPKVTAEAYCLFGHSAGAQFVHRMVLLMPEARFSMAIANGAGFYTEPAFNKNFPAGLKATPATEETLKKAFKKEVIILMGEQDKVSKTMPKAPEAFDDYDRVWKAKLFFTEAKAQADKLQVSLNWKFQLVPGAHHNDAIHAEYGSRLAAHSKRKIENDPNMPTGKP
jgi:dienelactone hydrolase